MKDVILVANADSSSLKISIFEIFNKKMGDKLFSIFLEKNSNEIVFHINQNHESNNKVNGDLINLMIDIFVSWWTKQQDLNLVATGHRIVHGSKNFDHPIIVNETTYEDLKDLIPLSPLHQPYNLQALNLFRQKYQKIPHIACFDTSFHSTNPPIARVFGLPKKYFEQGIIHYGFHGLSYKYVSSHFKEATGEDLPTLVLS